MLANTRRVQLAEAALTVLARDGSRGLTHRAVDRDAGVPEGSTSYYFRTRSALLAAAVERLASTDAKAIIAASGSAEELIEMLTRAVIDRDGSVPSRQLARLELTLEGQRHAALRSTLAGSGREIHGALTAALQSLSVEDATERATALLVTIDGLLVDRLMGTDARLADAEAVQALLRGVLSDAQALSRGMPDELGRVEEGA